MPTKKKKLTSILQLALASLFVLFASTAQADVTVTWVPGAVVEGTPVDEWLLYCAPQASVYPAPIIIPSVARTHTLLLPDGINKCKMQSRSINHIWGGAALASEDSVELTFLVAGGIRVEPSPNAPSLVIK